MKQDKLAFVILGLALILSNGLWAYRYQQLSLDNAQAYDLLDWDEQYMQDFQIHEQNLLMIKQ